TRSATSRWPPTSRSVSAPRSRSSRSATSSFTATTSSAARSATRNSRYGPPSLVGGVTAVQAVPTLEATSMSVIVVRLVTGTVFVPSASLQFCCMPTPVKASSLKVSEPESAKDEYSNVPTSSGATEVAGGGQTLPLRRNCALSAPLTVTQHDEM